MLCRQEVDCDLNAIIKCQKGEESQLINPCKCQGVFNCNLSFVVALIARLVFNTIWQWCFKQWWQMKFSSCFCELHAVKLYRWYYLGGGNDCTPLRCIKVIMTTFLCIF